MNARSRILALSGGVGGAKLALGLDRVLPSGRLTVVANTGDDFVHLGLDISPDVDTLLYTLAGMANPQAGWGRDDETWSFLAALEALGGESWFKLGDKDLALHVFRTTRRAMGMSLSAVTSELGARLGIGTAIVPMSDDPVRTEVQTPEGWLSFQHYFVKERCEPRVQGIRFEGASQAVPARGVIDALNHPDLSAIVICPSNPFLSVDPILAIPGLRRRLADSPAPVLAVSPVIAGQSVKGPTAKIMKELGLECSATTVARLYRDFVDGMVIDDTDADHTPAITAMGIQVSLTNTLMQTLDDRIRLARDTLRLADRLRAPDETTEDIPGGAEV